MISAVRADWALSELGLLWSQKRKLVSQLLDEFAFFVSDVYLFAARVDAAAFAVLESPLIVSEVLPAVGPEHQAFAFEVVVFEAAEVRLRLELPGESAGASELAVREVAFVGALAVQSQRPLAFGQAVDEPASVLVVFRFERAFSARQSVAPVAFVVLCQREPQSPFAVWQAGLELSLVHRNQLAVDSVDASDEVLVSRERHVLDLRVEVGHSVPPIRVFLFPHLFAEGVELVLSLGLQLVAGGLFFRCLEESVGSVELRRVDL